MTKRLHKGIKDNAWLMATEGLFYAFSGALLLIVFLVYKSNYLIPEFFFIIFDIGTFLYVFYKIKKKDVTIKSIFPFPLPRIIDQGKKEEKKGEEGIKWRKFKLLRVLYMIGFWLRPFYLRESINGQINNGFMHTSSLADQSSCSHIDQSCIGDTCVYDTYHPKGVFPWFGLNYKDDIQGVFCAMDQKWLDPLPLASHQVYGYTYTNVGGNDFPNCDTASTSPSAKVANVLICPNAYPDATLGLSKTVQIIYGATTLGEAERVKECPGMDTSEMTCFLGGVIVPCETCRDNCVNVRGRPRRICPFCLDYVRERNGRLIAEEYSHCEPYNAQRKGMYLCGMCPGRGQGWLADEVYTKEGINISFWLLTVYFLIIPGLEILVLLVVFAIKF